MVKLNRREFIFQGIKNVNVSSIAEMGALVNPITPKRSTFIDVFSKDESIRFKGITDPNVINKMPSIDII